MTTHSLRFPRGLYGITPEWDETSRLLDAIQAAYDGGMQVLQWRRKLALPQQFNHQLDAVIELCQRLSLPLLINDDWQLAAQLDVAGAHIGKDDGVLSQARAALHQPKWLGTSCYNSLDLANEALKMNVDYIAFGAVYPSSIKPNAPRATLEQLQQGRRLSEQFATSTRASIVAIGGIDPNNTAALIDAGVDAVAVISHLFEAEDVQKQARAFSRLFHL